MLRTPWFVDYGHLTFWFFFFATFVVIAWLAYIYVGVTQHVEQRKPVRETRGFSRAQTGDTLTAVLPLTWSVTMLAHAGTHSANFDENTTATVFSFTVIAYQWGWNYYFPREIASLLSTAPHMIGRGRTAIGHGQDRYALLLSKVRRDYLSQASLSTKLTAKHGRHVVSSTLASLLPSLVTNQTEAPQWVGASLRPLLNAELPSGDAGLLTGFTAFTALDESARLSLTWQRCTPARAPFYLMSQTPTPAPLNVTDASVDLPLMQHLLTLENWPLQLETQNLRPQSTVTLVGNRLNRVHRYLTSSSLSWAAVNPASRVAHIIRAHGASFSLGKQLGDTSVNDTHAHAPFTVENVWLNIQPKSLFLGGTHKDACVRWALASYSPMLQPGTLHDLNANQLVSGDSNGALPLTQTNPPIARAHTPSFFGYGQLGHLRLQSNRSAALWQYIFLNLRGDSVSLLGGDLRTLTSADNTANIAASAAEAQLSQQAQQRCSDHAKLIDMLWGAGALRGLSIPSTHLSSPANALSHTPIAASRGMLAFAGALHAKERGLLPLKKQDMARQPSLARGHTISFAEPGFHYWAAMMGVGPSLPVNKLDPNSKTRWTSFHPLKASGHQFSLTGANSMQLGLAHEGGFVGEKKTLRLETVLTSRVPSYNLPGALSFSFQTNVNLATPCLAATWLEATSEYQPTRVASAGVTDPLQLNAKSLSPQNNTTPMYGSSYLASWTYAWAWNTATSGLPWDRTYWTQYARRPQVGVGSPSSALVTQEQAALLPLQRQLFAKMSAWALTPRVQKIIRKPWYPELATATLDVDRAPLNPIWASVLPAPHVDVDPAFIFTRWAAEVNTSRRSDHDARFRVLWGPVNSGVSLAQAASTQSAQLSPWAQVSGPLALASLSAATRCQLFLSAASDLAGILSAEPAGLLTLSEHAVCRETAKPAATLPFLGSTHFFVNSRAYFNSIRTSSKAIYHEESLSLVGFEVDDPIILLGPWALLWNLSRHNQCLNSRHAGLAVENTDSYWKARLLAVKFFSEQYLLRHYYTQPRLQALGRQLAAETYAPLKKLMKPYFLCIAEKQNTPRQTSMTPRNGFTQLKLDVGAMRRLRVTKGVYLPSDTPMHGIFGSKDVIHSWAIPGLGVKIDCIPGYSSHRRLVLRWRGLFWGQCMEVCGRYHHWMPILVRVVHRDNFLVWCLTYIRALAARASVSSRTIALTSVQSAWTVAMQTS